ncbi:MAG: adenylate/guanylate cyclase domain-containing protein [Myxococcota bacterium]
MALPTLNLRFKLSVGLILIITVLMASLNIYTVLSHGESRRNDAARFLRVTSLLLANLTTDLLLEVDEEIRREGDAGRRVAEAITSERLSTTLSFLRTQQRDGKENIPAPLAYAMVLNPSTNTVLAGVANTALIQFPDGTREANERAALERIASIGGKLGGTMRTNAFDVSFGGKPRAKVLIGVSLADLEAAVRKDLITNIIALTIALIVMSVYASLTLGHLVVNPLRRVVDAMRAVEEGDLEQEVQLKRSDEMGTLGKTFNYMVQGLREREHLEDAFSRYVSRQVYEQLQGQEARLAGEVRDATILFSDIRSFTALSEQLTATDVVDLLNEYFTDMVEIIFKYDGFLNKFIGDAIMAVYNAPLEQSHPELRAVRTAVEMQYAVRKLNQRREARGQFPIRIGIGINTGAVVAGNIGHEQRLEYTVIGDAVNLAQRIESQTKVTGAAVLISETTYRAVAPHVKAEALPPVKVKGKQEPVTLYAVQGLVTQGQRPSASAG